MPSDKLTELGIRKSKSGKKEQKLYDGQGLYLLIHPNGSKYWRVKYRFLGKEKVLALGIWSNVSLTDARTMRNEAKIILKSGQDPNLVKQNILINKQIDQLNNFIYYHIILNQYSITISDVLLLFYFSFIVNKW